MEKQVEEHFTASSPFPRMTCPDTLIGFLVSLRIPDPGLSGLSYSDRGLELLGFGKVDRRLIL